MNQIHVVKMLEKIIVRSASQIPRLLWNQKFHESPPTENARLQDRDQIPAELIQVGGRHYVVWELRTFTFSSKQGKVFTALELIYYCGYL